MNDDGILAFCQAMQVDPQDPVMLVLSYYMQAKSMCNYTRQEFQTGLESLACYSMEELRRKIPQLREALRDKRQFALIYNVRDRISMVFFARSDICMQFQWT